MQAIIKEKHEEFEKNKKRYPSLDTVYLIFNYIIQIELRIYNKHFFLSAYFLQISFFNISNF